MRDNPKDTLAESPFASQCQLKEFLSNLKSKKMVLQISGAPIAKVAGFSNIMSAARQDFFPGFTLRRFTVPGTHDYSLSF
jgi:hypothetical protein